MKAMQCWNTMDAEDTASSQVDNATKKPVSMVWRFHSHSSVKMRRDDDV